MKATRRQVTTDSYFEVAVILARCVLVNTDGALDRMDGALAANMDLEGTGAGTGNLSATLSVAISQNISLHLPSMSGCHFMVRPKLTAQVQALV